MRVSERAPISSLDQAIVPDKLDFGPSRRMALGQFPGEELEASKVSAYVYKVTGEPAGDVFVEAYDARTGAPIGKAKTDFEGKISFDVGFSNKPILLKPVPPAGFSSMPEQALVKSLPVSGFLRDKWGWDESVRFVIYEKGKEPPPPPGKKDEDEGFFTWKNILLIGGIALVGYFILQHLTREE